MNHRAAHAIRVLAAVAAGLMVFVLLYRTSSDTEQMGMRADTTPTALVSPTPDARRTPIPRFEERMTISGGLWINARSVAGLVEAYAGSERCSGGEGISGPDVYGVLYSLIIMPAVAPTAFGVEGVPLTLYVNGYPVRQVVWQRGVDLRFDLVLGPAFARYHGVFRMPEDDGYDVDVQPVIDGEVCGKRLNAFQGDRSQVAYFIVVDPHELTPGCGREGAPVRFRVVALNEVREVVEVLSYLPETEIWHAGDNLATASWPMGFYGTVWADGRPARLDSRIEAFVDGAACPLTRLELYPSEDTTKFVAGLPSAIEEPGCGHQGATVTFEIDGRPSNEAYAWGLSETIFTDISTGPPFARYKGRFVPGPHPEDAAVGVVPVINGKICGYQAEVHESAGADEGYVVIVLPESLEPACGRDGAVVSFEVVWHNADRTVTRVRELPGTEDWAPGQVVKRWQ